jgi:hypothetical protein
MLFEMDETLKGFKPVTGMSIVDSLGEREKDLENYLKKMIGDIIFPDYLVFGNERSFQSEADLFAVNKDGDLVVFELKSHGKYDTGKIYQALGYAQKFSYWRYGDLNAHYKKCYKEYKELIDAFEEHYGYKIDTNEFNKKQKVVIISHDSSENTNAVTSYWKRNGLEIEEYFYRFYKVTEKYYFELSNELFHSQDSGGCWINTCSKHFNNVFLEMIKHQKAAAYGDRIGIIGEWLKNLRIFLYHNGYGIIAAGKGTATIRDRYNDDIEIDERYITLREFISGVNTETCKINQSISPLKIKELLARDFYFPNTIVTLSKSESEKLYEECQKLFI